VNEISAGRWAAGNKKYKQYVISVARTLKTKYKLKVVVFAPFDVPKQSATEWKALSKYAYIGIENYVDGRELKKNTFSLTWLKMKYQASVAAFARFGVSKSRLFVAEHYGNSLAAKSFGRGGISSADWIKTIKLRTEAIDSVGFKGFVAYSWWGNQMAETWKQRDKYYAAYLAGVERLP